LLRLFMKNYLGDRTRMVGRVGLGKWIRYGLDIWVRYMQTSCKKSEEQHLGQNMCLLRQCCQWVRYYSVRNRRMKCGMKRRMAMTGKTKCREQKLYYCHFFQNKSHIDSPETASFPPRWDTSKGVRVIG
jgi:hypothetical protein